MRFRRLILNLMLCTILVLIVWAVVSREEKVIYVDTAPVNIQTLYSTLTVSGTIVDTGTMALSAPKAARIEKIFVSEGSKVAKGQVIAQAVEVLGSLNLQWPAMSDDLKNNISYIGLEEPDVTSMLSQYIYSVFSGKDGELFYLKSPCDGIVTNLSVVKGDYVTSNFKVASVSDFSELEVSAYISEYNIGDLVEGLKVDLSGDAFDGKYEGVLTKIMPTAIDTGTLTSAGETVVEVRIRIKKPGADLKPGYSAKAVIYTVKKVNAMLVPYEAIFQQAEGTEAVCILKDEKPEIRQVKTGRELADSTEIISGITDTDRVILNPEPEQLSGVKVVAK